MRLLILLLACSALAMGACPKMLKGIKRSMFYSFLPQIPDAVDTACGRKTFTDMFWQTRLNDEMMQYVMRDTIRQNASLCSSACVAYYDKEYHAGVLAPLVQSLREAYAAIDNAEAKAYIEANYAYKTRISEMAEEGEINMMGLTSEPWYKNVYRELSNEAEVAYARTMKRAFGFVESADMRRYRIQTVMKALEKTVTGRDDKEIAATIGKLQKLVNETTRFSSVAYHVKQNAVWIRPVEILPAIETLYLQYRALTDKEAKAFIDSFLASWKGKYEGRDSDYPDYPDNDTSIKQRKLANGKPNNSAFDALSDETVSALTSAFPELFAYLYKHGYITRKSQGIF